MNIESYAKVRALLKRQSEGYQPKKSKAFTGDEIYKFITEAPDTKYLATKVALIMGVMGACRSNELYEMKTKNLQFFEGCINISVPITKTKVPRNFTVTGDFYNIVKKYSELRPSDVSSSFFLNFQNGKCTKQVIGINKFGRMGKEIAEFLKLPDPVKYTGHCLRRSSATLYADGGANMTALKRHGGWKSASVAEGYIADSKKNKMDAANKILHQINPNSISISNANSCPSTYADGVSNFTIDNFAITNKTSDVNINTTKTPPTIHFNNCHNLTINFINK
ncbi:uncharacterized protein LOC111692006 [Anoplophora glabripennis]|uniref:uncharacterized protein LOC111692006 n=1 Tax=Anoplophora glabripennis TaxID=217634 RepID=UPI000C760733|nr:uncharacterized protein LOC111692006 [Anoplophora glabripennis]